MLRKLKLDRILKSSLLALAMTISACTSPNDRTNAPSNKIDLAITNVDIFDSETQTVLTDKTILIDKGVISQIVDANTVVAANQTILGYNRLVVPGFIDTHAHLGLIYERGLRPGDEIGPPPSDKRAELSRQYLAHGTTTLVDMGQVESWLDTTLDWQDNPQPQFPNLYVMGGSLVSPGDESPPHFVEVTQETVEAKLTDYRNRGIERIKLYRKLELGDMAATIAAADVLGLRYYAHTDNGVVTIDQAMELGVRDFEHFFTVIPSALPFREEMGAVLEAQGLDGISSDDEFAATMVFFFDFANGHPEYKQNLINLFEAMAAKNASISTTLNILGSAAGRSSFFCGFNPLPERTEPQLFLSDAQEERLSDSFDVLMNYTKLAHDAGVTLRIGTDCKNGGQALLSELILLQNAGFFG